MIKPTSKSERINSLDFLEGLAILGILFINIENFAYPDSWSPWKYGFHSEVDRATRFWVYFLTQGKFATMFTLLFGVGFYLFIERLEKKPIGIRAIDIYSRRMFWLFMIGIVHAYFIWNGDVLYHYAICGLLLIPFRSFSNKALLFSVLILASIQMNNSFEKVTQRRISYNSFLAVKDQVESDRSALENKRVNYWNTFLKKKAPDTAIVKTPKATYLIGLQETYEQASIHKGMLYYQGFLFPSLMTMVLGIYLFRSGIFINYHSWKHYWLITLMLLTAGLIVNYYRYYHWTFDYFNPVLNYWQELAFTFNKQLLGFAYSLLGNGLYQKFLRKMNVQVISTIGRMALSNYLLQNIILGLLFYGYGLAWFNQFSRSELLVIVFIIWAAQMILSWLWNIRYNQGPVEGLWKKMTYNSFSSKTE